MALAQKLWQGKNADEKEAVLMNYVHGLGTSRLSLSDTGYPVSYTHLDVYKRQC